MGSLRIIDLQCRLSAFEWYRRLPVEPREWVLRTSQIRHFDSGDFVAHRGFAASHWIGVCSGLLKASASSLEGKQVSEVLASPREWTGDVEILLSRLRCYDIMALEASIVLFVSAQTFRWLVSTDIAFANFAMLQIAVRNAAAMEKFERPRQPAGAAAVANALSELLIQVMRRDGDAPVAMVRLSQTQIAEMVRLSRQTVNQGLKLLEERGFIRIGYNKIEIRDEGGLKTCAVIDELSEVRQSSRSTLHSICGLITPET
jgi:CRP/FNR family transcriptional regulator, cyclic AMP receptor protein